MKHRKIYDRKNTINVRLPQQLERILKRHHKEVPSTMGASIDNKSTPTQESLPTFVICFPQDSSDLQLQYATAETYVFCAIKLARQDARNISSGFTTR